jgi:hypothetical protein
MKALGTAVLLTLIVLGGCVLLVKALEAFTWQMQKFLHGFWPIR